MVSGHSNTEMRLLKRVLSRNSSVLKKRIESYDEKLKNADPESSVTTVWRAEKGRAEELLKNMLKMQLPLAYMA
jgi:GTP1/Obg family GTP-binding protein